jgi:malate synthase
METKTQLKIKAQKQFEEIFTPDLMIFLLSIRILIRKDWIF